MPKLFLVLRSCRSCELSVSKFQAPKALMSGQPNVALERNGDGDRDDDYNDYKDDGPSGMDGNGYSSQIGTSGKP